MYYKDPRSTDYRKPRKFYGTPLNKYMYSAIFISSGFIFTIAYILSPFPRLERLIDKFRFLPNKNVVGPIEWNLEQHIKERIELRAEITKQLQENKEVPT